MAKLIILAVVLFSFGVPIWFSTTRTPRRTLRRVQWIMLGCIIVWAYLCMHWYPSLVSLE